MQRFNSNGLDDDRNIRGKGLLVSMPSERRHRDQAPLYMVAFSLTVASATLAISLLWPYLIPIAGPIDQAAASTFVSHAGRDGGRR